MSHEVAQRSQSLHGHRLQTAVLNQLGQQRSGLGQVQPVVVGQISGGAHPEAAGGRHQQLAALIGLGRGGSGQHRGGQEPLGQAVLALEAGPTPGRQASAPEKPFERHLGPAPTPPRAPATTATAGEQLAGPERTPSGHLVEDVLYEGWLCLG